MGETGGGPLRPQANVHASRFEIGAWPGSERTDVISVAESHLLAGVVLVVVVFVVFVVAIAVAVAVIPTAELDELAARSGGHHHHHHQIDRLAVARTSTQEVPRKHCSFNLHQCIDLKLGVVFVCRPCVSGALQLRLASTWSLLAKLVEVPGAASR